jgi:hypothetical protein
MDVEESDRGPVQRTTLVFTSGFSIQDEYSRSELVSGSRFEAGTPEDEAEV